MGARLTAAGASLSKTLYEAGKGGCAGCGTPMQLKLARPPPTSAAAAINVRAVFLTVLPRVFWL